MENNNDEGTDYSCLNCLGCLLILFLLTGGWGVFTAWLGGWF